MSECVICLGDYTSETSYKTTCNHTFCFDCIIMWCNGQAKTNVKPNCPMCRSLLDITTIKTEYKKKFPLKDENKSLSFEELIKLSGVHLLQNNMIVIDVAQEKNNFFDSLKKLISYSFIKLQSKSTVHDVERINMSIVHKEKKYMMIFKTPKVRFMAGVLNKYSNMMTDKNDILIHVSLDEKCDSLFVSGLQQLQQITLKLISREHQNFNYTGIIKKPNELTSSRQRNDYIKLIANTNICTFFSGDTADNVPIAIESADDINNFMSGEFIFEHRVILIKNPTTNELNVSSKLRIIQGLLLDERPKPISKISAKMFN